MSGADILDALGAARADIRGVLEPDRMLADIAWFRVGGPADLLFQPADEEDLATFLAALPQDFPVMPIGLGSNLLVRDGGVPGVVVRLSARGFGKTVAEEGHRLRTGTAVPDVRLAKAAADAGLAGLAFYRGIPGGIGGALRMNAGAYGGETKDRLIEARAVDRKGQVHILRNEDFGYAYRHSEAPADLIFTEAVFQGEPGDPAEIREAMAKITESREATQPVKSRTGGSTFKNPPGGKAWQLVDQAGCRGLTIGGAQVSELHCNFLLNTGNATASDLERLGETVRARVLATSRVRLDWEIKRIGTWPAGVVIPEFTEAAA
ncbi:UDP-N-acetylmuramate dehydrogenase [Amorphus orientalis]|uniref:UDP-N-acetylenolpyruvoylglucosamine reductase n=1 Tax=Amorphus orientalis TaxID=649198 RepID=A0AAE3VNK8_9HYPH|nr:UDP-N-acetylmuramate dehydrogenase [Amorphus orientalis]MDQ0315316.1 UDP-N-acetylmuramate dehydrogenase [Amorphus orientalis]